MAKRKRPEGKASPSAQAAKKKPAGSTEKDRQESEEAGWTDLPLSEITAITIVGCGNPSAQKKIMKGTDQEERQRRVRQFMDYLELMSQRAKTGSKRGCFIVIEEYRDHTSGFELAHFVQIAFNHSSMLIDLPNTTVTKAEAEMILRDKPAFFFASISQTSEGQNSPMAPFKPLQREYAYGDEEIAAEDIAYLFFDVWRFPVDVRLFVTTAAFGTGSQGESHVPID